MAEWGFILLLKQEHIDLKARFFTFTGAGLIARFYTGFTPVTLPSPEPVFSLRPDQPAFRDFDIYAVTAPTSLGTKWAADIFAEGNTSNQSKRICWELIWFGLDYRAK